MINRPFTLPHIPLRTIILAQKASSELITDYPNQTESSSSVSIKSLQMGIGFISGNKNNFTSTQLP